MKRSLTLAALIGLAGCSSIDGLFDPPRPPLPSLSTTAALPPDDPLQGVVRLELPDTVRTVDQAARYMLEATHYTLVLSCQLCPIEAQEIGAKPISPLAFTHQVTTVNRALLLIAGSGTRLIIDTDTHQITFAYKESQT